MSGAPDEAGEAAGAVFAEAPDGRAVRIHDDQGTDYHLHDIAELFEIGEAGTTEAGEPALELSDAEVRRLKAMADAYSFDHDEGLIALCLDIHRFALEAQQPRYRLWQTF